MNNLFDSPVFVVGSVRSGTTLLASILLSSREFAIYEAETLLLSVCQRKYGNIKKEKNYKRFINDWINSKQFLRSGLDAVEFKSEVNKYRETYTDFLRFFMESIAKKQGMKRWTEKTPGHLFHMELLSQAFPNAKFIHVIRDGRDVAVSKRKVGWIDTKSRDPSKRLLWAAKSWEIAIKKGRAYGKKLGNNYIEIRYEDMINNLDAVLKKLNNFAQIKIDKKKINDSSVGSLGRANTAFNDRMEGISSKALGRWKKNLTEEEICVLHFAIGKTLIELGYEVDNFKNMHRPIVPIGIRIYSIMCPLSLNTKRLLKQKTLLGRLTSEGLELV